MKGMPKKDMMIGVWFDVEEGLMTFNIMITIYYCDLNRQLI